MTLEDYSSTNVGDGSIGLPKITTTTIRSRPERCRIKNAPVGCFLVHGRAVAEQLMPPPNGIPQGTNPAAFTALIADDNEWGSVTFDDENEPDAIYRSSVLFLPYTAHLAVLRRLRTHGSVLITLDFWAEPANSKLGYRWTYCNLAQFDPNNPTDADRLLRTAIKIRRQLHQ